METPEPASAAPVSSSEPATESAWERGLRHAKQVSLREASLFVFQSMNVRLSLTIIIIIQELVINVAIVTSSHHAKQSCPCS